MVAKLTTLLKHLRTKKRDLEAREKANELYVPRVWSAASV